MRLGIVVGCCLLLVAGSAVAGQARLTWTDNATNEMGFEVERLAAVCGGAGAWAALGGTAANVVAYTDATVQEGASYCYRVRAWNTVDGTATGTKQYSGWSNPAGTTIPFSPPAAPSLLGVTSAP